MYKYLVMIWLVAGFVFIGRAQTPDTTSSATPKVKAKDTLKATRQDTDIIRSNAPKIRKPKVYHIDTTHSPHKAVIRSLIIPGWGQVYNHKIWKVPIIYGALGLLGDAIVFNNKYYKEFLQLSIYRNHLITPKPGDPYYNEFVAYKAAGYSDQAIYNAKDGYRRNRDLSILGVVVFWGVNAVDAYIDAKFIHSYTLDNNFSMKITPSVLNPPTLFAQNSGTAYIPGIKATFTF